MKHYKLLQLTERKDYRFMSYAYALKNGFDINDYEEVYEGDINVIDSVSDAITLELLFNRFNINHPADFTGHSMSESDIVILDGKAYYCDMVGFKEIA